MVHKVAKHGNILLELHLDRPELERKAKHVCIHLLHDWKDVHPDTIEVSEISGGITNVLWKLHPAEKALDAVVVRIFGKQTDKIIDRDQEKRVLGPLNKAGFGAQFNQLELQVLGTFENGRIEEFLEMRPLEPDEMTDRNMAERIALRLQQFHSIDTLGSGDPQLFATIQQWMEQAADLDFSQDKAKAKAHRDFDFDRMRKSLQTVQQLTQELSPRVCFTHNDLLSGNILVPKQEASSQNSTENVQFIDFEYSGFSYGTFDIGNHFCEYAGLECDYSRFPDDNYISHFLSFYLFRGEPKSTDHEAVEKAKVECKLLSLAANHYWGTWGILQAKYSPIKFDYITYAKQRWEEAFKREEEFVGQARAWLREKQSKQKGLQS